MDWQTIQQLLRIVLYSAGAFLFGDAVANGSQYQALIGGVINVGSFLWWLYQQKKLKAVNVPPVVPVLALIVILPLLLGGCSEYVDRAVAWYSAVMGRVQQGLTTIRIEAEQACAQIGQFEYQAEVAAATLGGACSKWHVKVVQARKSAEAVCKDLHKLDDNIIGNYIGSVGGQLKTIKATKPEGC
jgi:hypothetical protein